MPRSRLWTLLLAFALLAMPAAAEVYHVVLKNGTEIETTRQPQQASWDPNMVLFATEVGNWVGFSREEIESIRAENPTQGYGVQINDKAIALGWSPNDLPEPAAGRDPLNERMASIAERMLELSERQQRYSVDQFVEPGATQGIPATFGGYTGGATSGFGSIPLEPNPERLMEPQDRISNDGGGGE